MVLPWVDQALPDSLAMLTTLDILALPLGLAMAWAYVAYARRFGDRELQVLASGLMAAALVYVIAAAVQGETEVVVIELVGTAAFGVFAALGLRKASVWLAIGWILHVGWDLVAQLAEDPVLPLWYAISCLAFDLVVAAAILRGRHGNALRRTTSATSRASPPTGQAATAAARAVCRRS